MGKSLYSSTQRFQHSPGAGSGRPGPSRHGAPQLPELRAGLGVPGSYLQTHLGFQR